MTADRNGNNDDDDRKDDLREEHEADPDSFEDKYGVDPDVPYEPIPGNPADGSN